MVQISVLSTFFYIRKQWSEITFQWRLCISLHRAQDFMVPIHRLYTTQNQTFLNRNLKLFSCVISFSRVVSELTLFLELASRCCTSKSYFHSTMRIAGAHDAANHSICKRTRIPSLQTCTGAPTQIVFPPNPRSRLNMSLVGDKIYRLSAHLSSVSPML